MISHSDQSHRNYGLKLLPQLPASEIPRFRSTVLAMADAGTLQDRLQLSSVAQKLPSILAMDILKKLALSDIDPDDHNLPLMIWYGLEPLVIDHPDESLAITQFTKLPLLQRFIARRLTSEIENNPTHTEQLVAALQTSSPNRQEQLLLGMSQALRGWRKTEAPRNWSHVAIKLSKSDNRDIRELSQELSLVFGDGRAMDDLRKIATDTNADYETRQRAVSLLAKTDIEGLNTLLIKLLSDRNVTLAVLKAMVNIDDPAAAQEIIKRFGSFRTDWKPFAIQTLTSRVTFAEQLLSAIEKGQIPSSELSAAQAREIQNLGDSALNKQLAKVWGTLRQTPAEKQKLIVDYKQRLSDADLTKVDFVNGRKLYTKSCANCHKLFGEGASVAPDLTGSNRDNLDYLLMNILDPSGVVPQAFKVSVIVLEDGRVLTGVIGRDDGQTVEIQTAKDKLIVSKSDIELIKKSDLSLMPDGLFEKLNEAEIRDMIGYLQSRRSPKP